MKLSQRYLRLTHGYGYAYSPSSGVEDNNRQGYRISSGAVVVVGMYVMLVVLIIVALFLFSLLLSQV